MFQLQKVQLPNQRLLLYYTHDDLYSPLLAGKEIEARVTRDREAHDRIRNNMQICIFVVFIRRECIL
jgi:hypothetical protein